jgi:membrane-bound lytic murein transglycosylase F
MDDILGPMNPVERSARRVHRIVRLLSPSPNPSHKGRGKEGSSRATSDEKQVTKKKASHIPAILVFLCFLYMFTPSCVKQDRLEAILQSGEITVLTRNNGHCYYTYREKSMGFEYDLAKAFSEHLGVKLKVKTPALEGLLHDLDRGEGDVVAAGMTVMPSRQEKADFSESYLLVRQQVIRHKENNGVRKIEDLRGKTIHVGRGTSYERRLKALKDKGLDMEIVLHDDVPTEELIRMVAEKGIELTVADSNVAVLNRRYYPEIRMAFVLGEEESLGWAVRKGEKALLHKVNEFFGKIKADGTFENLYNKYYANVEIFDYVDLKKYHERLDERLPKFEATIRKAARKSNFDWRLIAAVVYQESHFDPEATSYTGVQGIMQLTRDTADHIGVGDHRDPEQSIMGGVKYLRKLYKSFREAEDPDRTYIALASYNVGRGHVLDAQKIAVEKGLDPNTWSSLEQVLPLLRYRKYYKNTEYGYCRGTEPVRFVNRIRIYYDILRREAQKEIK